MHRHTHTHMQRQWQRQAEAQQIIDTNMKGSTTSEQPDHRLGHTYTPKHTRAPTYSHTQTYTNTPQHRHSCTPMLHTFWGLSGREFNVIKREAAGAQNEPAAAPPLRPSIVLCESEKTSVRVCGLVCACVCVCGYSHSQHNSAKWKPISILVSFALASCQLCMPFSLNTHAHLLTFT